MNVKPSPHGSNPVLADNGLDTPDQFGLATALYHPAFLLTDWQTPLRVQSAESQESETASPIHVAFAALMALASVLLVVFAR